jgi:CBS domain-containing protein
MRCKDIMKRDVECLAPGESVEAAATRMKDENVGFLPVCDDSRKVLGTLTDRDIVIRVVAGRKPGSTPVEGVMTHEVVSCRPEDDIRDAERAMAENHKSRMMCCDEAGRLVGVISLSDIAQHESGRRASDTLREITSREARA